MQETGTMDTVTPREDSSVSDRQDPLIQLRIHPLKKWMDTVPPDSTE